MDTPAIPPLRGNNKIPLRRSGREELLAIAKGMKKDGFTEKEIAEETQLPLSIINNIGTQRM